MTDLAAQSTIISAATYGAANQLLSLSGGSINETRTYNSMLQLTGLNNNANGVTVTNITYNYSSTQNNGKITSQTDNISGEQVTYAYDALNRLASAAATGGSWGQSYAYDGFGNLTDQNVTAGSAPSYHVVPDPATNHVGTTDANGNSTGTGCAAYVFDVENRMRTQVCGATFVYSYAPGNKRVWRANLDSNGNYTVDEVTFWSVTGQKLATYSLQVTNGSGNLTAPQMTTYQTATNYYFGGKLIMNANGYLGTDRLGSIGKCYPYGQEKPSSTQNGTEKFATYFRDSETGLDYAHQRYHSPGGRFLTVDQGTPPSSDPGSWNRYSYVNGDPVNLYDPTGRLGLTADSCDAFPEDPDCYDGENNFDYCDMTKAGCTGAGGGYGGGGGGGGGAFQPGLGSGPRAPVRGAVLRAEKLARNALAAALFQSQRASLIKLEI